MYSRKPSNNCKSAGLSKSFVQHPLTKSKSKEQFNSKASTHKPHGLLACRSSSHCQRLNSTEKCKNYSFVQIKQQNPTVKAETEVASLANSIKKGSFGILMAKTTNESDSNRNTKNGTYKQSSQPDNTMLNTSFTNKSYVTCQVPSTTKQANPQTLPARPRCQSRHNKGCEMSLFKENKYEKENEPMENKMLRLTNEMKEKVHNTQGSEEEKYKLYRKYFDVVISLYPTMHPTLNEVKCGYESYITHLQSESSYQADKFNKLQQKCTAETKELEKDKESMLKEIIAQQKQMECQALQIKKMQHQLNCNKETYIYQIDKLKSQLKEKEGSVQENFGQSIELKENCQNVAKNMVKKKIAVPSLNFNKLQKKSDELKLVVKPTKHISYDSDSSNRPDLNKTDIDEHKKPTVPKLNLNFLNKVANHKDYHNEFMSKANDFSNSWKDLLLKEAKL